MSAPIRKMPLDCYVDEGRGWVGKRLTSIRTRRREAVVEVSLPEISRSSPSADDAQRSYAGSEVLRRVVGKGRIG